MATSTSLAVLNLATQKKKEITRWQFSPHSGDANSATTRFLVWGYILANVILIGSSFRQQ